MDLEHELNRSWTLFQSGVPLYLDKGRLATDDIPRLEMTPAPGLMTQDALALGDQPTPTIMNDFARGAMGAIGGGLRDTAQQALNLGAELLDNQNRMDNRPQFAREAVKDLLPNFKPESTIEGLARGGVNIISALMLTRGLGMGGSTMGNLASSAFVDALMDPEEGNLSTLARELGFDNELTQYLDNKVGEDAGPEERLRARLLGVMEGAGIGTLIDGVMRGFKVIKDNPEASAKVLGILGAGAATMTPGEAEGSPLSKMLKGVTIGEASDAAKVLQISPEFRVTVQGIPEPTGKAQYVTNAINPKNVAQQSARLDDIATKFPDPLSDERAWSLMQSTVYNSKEVPIPPRWLIEHVNDMPKWSSWFSKLTPEQISGATKGFSVSDDFRNLYRSGAGVETTGHLMLWSMMSRMLSAFPHESGFLDIAAKADPFIKKAARGEWSAADFDAWKKMVAETIPLDSPGRSATSNANDFGGVFLRKMSEKTPEGITKLEALHNMIADPNMTGPEIRRAFYGLAEDVGIKNKVLSFALLVSGRNDVIVLDRIQINQMFGNGNKIYDNIQHLFDNGPGLATYEALERSIGSRVKELYASVGRPDDASLGRYHWETWVLSSGQIVDHPTLKTIVADGNKANAPFAEVPVAEGRFHRSNFGATYERTPEGDTKWVYRTSDGTPYRFQKQQLDAMFKEAMKPKNGVVPKDFPGVSSFEGGDKPWHSYPGVDRGKLDEYVRQYGQPDGP